jgi:DNA-binding response OmpR family regulator
MKKIILVIDESPLFREYLKTKLSENELDVEVDVACNTQEGISRMRIGYPDLIIMDYPLGKQTYLDVLKEKKLNPNTAKVPAIIITRKIDQRKIIELVPFGVIKVFTKPIKIDTLFKTITQILGVKFEIDNSPGIVDVHVNEDIIFIELAQGLNGDKLDLLFFKIKELSGLYNIKFPKIVVILSDISLKAVEINKLEKLLTILLKISKAKRRIIRVLTNDSSIKQFITGQNEYAEFKMVSNLQEAMDGLVVEKTGEKENSAELLAGALLAVKDPERADSMQLHFDADSKKSLSAEEFKEAIQNLKIGVVDDDYVIQELIKNTFQGMGATVKTYSGGMDFLGDPEIDSFDLVFLDIIMPQMDGFAVLRDLQNREYQSPIIILSAMNKQEMVIRAFQMGVKSYLIKPLHPEKLLRKTIEILKPNF